MCLSTTDAKFYEGKTDTIKVDFKIESSRGLYLKLIIEASSFKFYMEIGYGPDNVLLEISIRYKITSRKEQKTKQVATCEPLY